jgi:hypothetical protein
MSAWTVVIAGTYLGQIVNNVLGIRGAGDVPAGTQGQEVARVVNAYWRADIVPLLSSAYQLSGVTAVSMTNPEIGAENVTTDIGGDLGDPISGAICAPVDIQTGLRGRAFRGRTGLTGLTETGVTGNTIVQLKRDALQNGMTTFRSRLVSPTITDQEAFDLGVISRYKGVDAQGKPLLRPGGPIFTNSIAVVVRSKVGTRVSRLR